MDVAAISDRQYVAATAPAPSTRNRSDEDYARQAAVDDSVRQERRAARNRDAMRRRTHSAFEQSIEQDKSLRAYNERAEAEKMVRMVMRKEAAEMEAQRADRVEMKSSLSDPHAKAELTRQKVDAAYATKTSEALRDEVFRPSPSQRQQQRALEKYQEPVRNTIDRTVDLVV